MAASWKRAFDCASVLKRVPAMAKKHMANKPGILCTQRADSLVVGNCLSHQHAQGFLTGHLPGQYQAASALATRSGHRAR